MTLAGSRSDPNTSVPWFNWIEQPPSEVQLAKTMLCHGWQVYIIEFGDKTRLMDTSIRGLPLQPAGSKKTGMKRISGFGVLCPAKSKSFFVVYERDRRLRRIGKYSKIMPREAHLEARRRYCQTRKKRLKSTKAAVSVHLEDIRARFARMHFETTGGTS
ncbi:hypothetical protein [Roseobacter sp.]|uniref:hypothetical protein n=1 Tax=Roseobacter sp. TaxID=1907202 RepID=UPI0029663160|nr:hypothetical protein [Roseobacter sp.]MDW3180876.1 hypothetical protein [Roseobacter sp.]